MFNLTESFKRGYESFLEEQAEAELEQGIENLEQAQKEAEDSFRVFKEYFAAYAAAEGTITEETRVQGYSADESKEFMSTLSRLVGGDETLTKAGYQPLSGFATVKTISDMKFPNNILFFIQSLISFIGTLVKKVISFFTNGLQRLFGLTSAPEFKSDFKLNLEKAQTLEVLAMPSAAASSPGLPKAARLAEIGLDNIEKVLNVLSPKTLREGKEEEETEKDASKEGKSEKDREKVGVSSGQPVKVLVLDMSKEMEGLQQGLQHFLDLFDGSYGSNSEYLFDTEDLKLLLELFKSTMKSVVDGTVPSYAVSGQLSELETINKEKLLENLKRTNLNVENLKRAFMQTEGSIQSILKALSTKQILAAETMGVQFRFYSAGTYVQMVKILEVIGPRIKDAESLEKKLGKMREVFDKLVVELGKQRQAILSFGNVVYTSVYQKRINDLFDSARIVSQTITLRLTVLALYIRQMKNIYESIRNANAINARAKDFLKSGAFADSGIGGGLFSSGLTKRTPTGLFGFFKK